MDEAEHDVKQGSSSPPPMKSLNPIDNNNAPPSADDLAWADSCLMKFTEASDADWGSFKESLLEILNVPTEPATTQLAADNGKSDHIEMEDHHTFPSGESVAAAFSMMTDDHSDFTDEDEESVEEGNDNAIGKKKKEQLNGKNWIENALLPDHAEFVKVETNDVGFDVDSLPFEAETSFSDAIFKVWDLGVSDEQDEFTKALNDALGVSSSTGASNSGVVEEWQEPLDDLTAGISKLYLGQSSN